MLVHIPILVEYVGYLLLLLAIQLFPKDHPDSDVSLFSLYVSYFTLAFLRSETNSSIKFLFLKTAAG